MSGEQISRINSVSFIICLAAVVAGVVVGLLGIWQVIPTEGDVLWRALGTCGVVFGGSVAASMAIRCFKTNE